MTVSKYIWQLHDAIVNETKLENYPAAMTILHDNVMDSFGHQTCDKVRDLTDVIEKMFYSIKVSGLHEHLDSDRNVDMAELNIQEKAFLKGQIVAYLDIMNQLYRERPFQEQLDVAFDNLNILVDIGSNEFTKPIVYDESTHGILFEKGLITTRNHAGTSCCMLTPLGKGYVQDTKYKMWLALTK